MNLGGLYSDYKEIVINNCKFEKCTNIIPSHNPICTLRVFIKNCTFDSCYNTLFQSDEFGGLRIDYCQFNKLINNSEDPTMIFRLCKKLRTLAKEERMYLLEVQFINVALMVLH